MKETKDVGLEDVKILDFVEDSEVAKPSTETKTTEAELEGIQSYPWKSVSHIVIGPNGVSLVPTGIEKKFSLNSADKTYYPTPGQAPTMLDYDIEQLVGSMNAVSNLEKELTKTRAELEKTKTEFTAFVNKTKADNDAKLEVVKKAEAEKPMPPEEDKKEKPVEEKVICEEKAKEEIAKAEKIDASIAGTVAKTEEHTGNLADAIKLMQVAKKKNLL